MARQDLPLTRALAAFAFAAMLAGCQLPSPYRAAPPAQPPTVRAPATPGSTAAPAGAAASAGPPQDTAQPVQREFRLGVAAQSLVTQARAQLARGDLQAASAALDRALRIEPSNPLLWIEMARLGLAADDGRQAEGYARKALSLAGSDRRARSYAGRALADALRAQHRDQEARELETQPWMN
jgi:tetratricopeptide (TPR) repeat protein